MVKTKIKKKLKIKIKNRKLPSQKKTKTFLDLFLLVESVNFLKAHLNFYY